MTEDRVKKSGTNIKIIIADDHRIMREGLRTLIEKHPGMEVVGEAENGRTAIKMVRKASPDIVIMDIAMPDMNGIEATRHIIDEFQKIKVLVLSMHADRRFIVKVLHAGASGYLLKDCAFEECIDAIHAVAHNKVFLSSQITKIVVEDYIHSSSNGETSVFSVLTDREREVLQLIAEGKSTKEISSILCVSVKTVEAHRKNIMGKLDLNSIAELTKYAVREGLTSIDY